VVTIFTEYATYFRIDETSCALEDTTQSVLELIWPIYSYLPPAIAKAFPKLKYVVIGPSLLELDFLLYGLKDLYKIASNFSTFEYNNV